MSLPSPEYIYHLVSLLHRINEKQNEQSKITHISRTIVINQQFRQYVASETLYLKY